LLPRSSIHTHATLVEVICYLKKKKKKGVFMGKQVRKEIKSVNCTVTHSR